MSLKDIENRKANDRIDLDELPENFVATVTDTHWDTDENKKECLYVEYTAEDDRVFTQKYSEMHLKDLAEAMKSLNIDDLADHKFQLKKKNYRIGFPRMIPTEVLK